MSENKTKNMKRPLLLLNTQGRVYKLKNHLTFTKSEICGLSL
jgi:hypothetical protein